MSENCATCRFFDQSDDTSGICRRYPPVLDTKVLTDDDECASWSTDWWMQPQTSPHDWCGEYQPQPSAPAHTKLATNE